MRKPLPNGSGSIPVSRIISRDRSKDYQRGATDGAPAAQQVIDRWHVLKNLREAIERFLSHSQESEADGLATPPRQKRTSGERARSQGSREHRLALYRASSKNSSGKEEPSWGLPGNFISAIEGCASLFAPPVSLNGANPHAPRAPLIRIDLNGHERWQQGCHATGQLWHELQERGFSGSWMMVYRWVQLQGDGKTEALAPPSVPQLAPRPLAWLDLA